MDTTPVAITYGRTYNNEIATFFVKDTIEAKKVAKTFIQVIPDDLEVYIKNIDSWDGKVSFVITHQDDDTFYFNATPCNFFMDDTDSENSDFMDFVEAFAIDSELHCS